MKKVKFNLQFFGWNDITAEPKNDEEKVQFTTFEPGVKTVIRVLSKEPFTRFTHWLSSQKRSITCGGGDCLLCQINKSDKANNLEPKYPRSKKHVLIIWNYNTNRIELLEQGKGFYEMLFGIHEALGDIRDTDIMVTRRGTGTQTTYVILPTGKGGEPSGEVMEACEKSDIDLKERFKPFTNDFLKDIISGKTFEEAFEKMKQDTEGDLPF